jgi:hypothetical protein
LAPRLYPTDLCRAAEVIAIAVLAEPLPLASGFACLAAHGVKTVALTVGGSGIGNEKLTATAAFTSALRRDHREANLRRTLPRRKPKKSAQRKANSKKEEELLS